VVRKESTQQRLQYQIFQGVRGDAMNITLAAVAYNFKRTMKVPLNLIKIISEIPIADDVLLK